MSAVIEQQRQHTGVEHTFRFDEVKLRFPDMNRSQDGLLLGFEVLNAVSATTLLVETAHSKGIELSFVDEVAFAHPAKITQTNWYKDIDNEADTTSPLSTNRVFSGAYMEWVGEYDPEKEDFHRRCLWVGVIDSERIAVGLGWGYMLHDRATPEQMYTALKGIYEEYTFPINRANKDTGFLPLLLNGQIMPKREQDISLCREWIGKKVALGITILQQKDELYPKAA